uniref:60S acidic ribosomal protein P2 n=1 Tax=Chaetoceros debilis TaxID=122233 RepID=A0A7S3Q3F3_9STRA
MLLSQVVNFNNNQSNIKMQEAAAYMLLVIGGNASPSADDVKNVLTAGGVAEPNEESITALVSDLDGKDINELLADGAEKLKDIPMGGSGGGGGGGGAAAGGDAAEEPEEEVIEEEEAPAATDMFGGGDGGDY